MVDFEKKLAELYVELPEPPKLLGGVVACQSSGKLVFVGQHFPYVNGKMAHKGRLGIEVRLDHGAMAARYAVIGCLSSLKQHLGSLNKVDQILQMTGFISSGGDFLEQDRVLEGASQLLIDIFGPHGKHTRQAVGVTQIPSGACVGISLIVAVK